MIEVIIFIAGIAVGSLATMIINLSMTEHKSGYGQFSLDPVANPADPGTYTVSVTIFPHQPLMNKEQIILIKSKDSRF